MSKFKNKLSAALVFAISAGAVPSDCASQAQNNRNVPLLMDRQREIDMAISAGPAAAARESTVYLLTAGGYEIVKHGVNGFSCIVERSDAAHPEEVLPTCYDPEGTRSILPVRLFVAELRSQGKEDDEVQAEIAKGYLSGRFRPAQRVGIAYMLSPQTRYFQLGKVVAWAPHVMIYAPFLTNQDIGAERLNLDHVSRMPTIGYEGTPYAFIIVPVREHDIDAQVVSEAAAHHRRGHE